MSSRLEAEHLFKVFRVRPGEVAELLDGRGTTADAVVEHGRVLRVVRRLVIGEGDAALRETLRREFTLAGFEVEVCATGPETLEACITFKPHAVVMRLELDGMSADEVVGMLHRLPGARQIRAVVYGMDLPEAQLEHVANLDIPQSGMIRDLTVNTILDRTMAVTGGAA